MTWMGKYIIWEGFFQLRKSLWNCPKIQGGTKVGNFCFQERAILCYLKLSLLCNQISGFQLSIEADRERESGLGFNKNIIFIMLYRTLNSSEKSSLFY